MKRCIKKTINCEKVKVTQGREEISALLQGRFTEAYRKHNHLDPPSVEDQALMGQHFRSQSAPDIRRKLWKLRRGPRTPVAQLVDIAFSVFNNGDQEERLQQETRQGKV